MKLSDVIQRGTSGARPAANTVPEGTLYFSTDTIALHRSDGAAWEDYSPASGGADISDKTYLTDTDESADLANSRRLLAGTNISFDDSVANQRTLNVASASHIVFKPIENEPPTANFAVLDTRNNRPILKFDGATDQEAVFTGIVPSYAGLAITVDTFWSFTSAVANNLRVQIAFERINESGLDITGDSFAAFKSVGGVAPGISGQIIKLSINFDPSEIDGLLVGEMFRIKIRRDADGTSGTDDIPTEAELHLVRLEM
jgi:hypothetical protein